MSTSSSRPDEASAFEREELAAVARLAARLWLFEVDAEMLSILRNADIVAAFSESGFPVPETLADKNNDAQSAATENDSALIDELAVDFCSLLVGPKGHVPPVESVWRSDRFEGQPAADSRTFFELLPRYQPPSKISDHIGTQLDFVAAVLEADTDEPEVFEIVVRFARQRLEWTAPFLSAVERRENKFYCWLAKLTADLIDTLRNLSQ
ncbi:MAG: molecular chaperone TorD family protein [Planctomycetota bacterium]